MRYSLMTLLLTSLFIGSLMACWMLRGSWKLERVFGPQKTDIFEVRRKFFPPRFDFSRKTNVSPDGQRYIEVSNEDRANLMYEGPPVNGLPRQPVLFKFPEGGFIFLDNDSALIINSNFAFWRRRYPEWWWGHFFRPEVWSAIVFGGMLVFNVVRREIGKKRA